MGTGSAGPATCGPRPASPGWPGTSTRGPGIGPADIDVAQLYENFTGQVLMTIEDFGFCARGEGGPFVEGGTLEWPHGDLPINTAGGNLAEAYIHGLSLVNEGVRQLRGDSTAQVDAAEHCLVVGGSVGAAVERADPAAGVVTDSPDGTT